MLDTETDLVNVANRRESFRISGMSFAETRTLLCHVFEGSSTDEEATVSPLLLLQTVCTLPWVAVVIKTHK